MCQKLIFFEEFPLKIVQILLILKKLCKEIIIAVKHITYIYIKLNVYYYL